jgi:hypothetical protein
MDNLIYSGSALLIFLFGYSLAMLQVRASLRINKTLLQRCVDMITLSNVAENNRVIQEDINYHLNSMSRNDEIEADIELNRG